MYKIKFIMLNFIIRLSAMNYRFLFLIYCILGLLLTYLSQAFFITEELFYYSLGEQVAIERFGKLWAESQKWAWLGYLFVPILYLVKFTLVSFCIV
ncbi:MAG: hypothetical protein EAZ08_07900, partial [Cytophagales bacterium]